MKIGQLIVAAALIAMAHQTAVFAQPAPAKASAEQPISSQDVVNETAAFANWLLALSEAASPAIDAARSIQGEWAQAMQNPDSRRAIASFRPVLSRTEQATALARQQILALETPAFAVLDLPSDLQTPELRNQMVQTVDQIAAMIRAFNPLLDAIAANDNRAGQAAAVQMFDAARTLYSSQRLFARAGMATIESGSPEYYSVEFDVLFYEAGARLIESAARLAAGNADPELGGDLLRYADRIDEIAAGGATAAAEAKREYEESANVLADVASRTLLDRGQQVDVAQQRAFRLWRSFGDTLRTGGTRASARPVTFADIRTMTGVLGPTRAQLDEIALEQARILAGQQ